MTIVNPLPNTLVNGQTADATAVMANFNQIVSNVNANAAANGTNSDITELTGLTTPLSGGQGGSTLFMGGTSTGAANAQVVATTTPNSFALITGYRVSWIAGYSNTGPLTLNVKSTGVETVKRRTPSGLQALMGGEIVLGQAYTAEWDGTQFELLDQVFGGLGALTYLLSPAAATLVLAAANAGALVDSGAAGGALTVTLPSISGLAEGSVYGVQRNTNNVTLQTSSGDGSSIISSGGSTTSLTIQTQLDYIIVMYDGGTGWRVLGVSPGTALSALALPAPLGVQASFKNLKVTNGATVNSQVAVTADSVMLENGSGAYYAAASVNLTLSTASAGANGLDTGTVASSTWYSAWVIYDPTTRAVAGLLSTSATAPTLPVGYTHKARVGWVRTDASSNLFRTLQFGRKARYQVTGTGNALGLPLMASSTNTQIGNIGTPTWVSIAVGGFVPATASAIDLLLSSTGSSSYPVIGVVPNTNYGAYQSTSNPPLVLVAVSSSPVEMLANMQLESTNIFWATNSGQTTTYQVYCYGWEDNI